MVIHIAIWIIVIGKLTWEYDKYFSNQLFEKNLSESPHFMLFSFIITAILYIIHKQIFPDKKEEILESIYWIIFITTMGASCRNELGKDLNDFHYVAYSIAMLYCTYIHKQFFPREETFIAQKIIIIWLITLKIYWPPLAYVWPYWPRKQRPYPEDLFDDWFYVDL